MRREPTPVKVKFRRWLGGNNIFPHPTNLLL